MDEKQAKEIKKNLLEQLKKYPDEQVAEIRKQIEDASPRELEEFINAQQAAAQATGGKGGAGECIFCQIVSGKVETTKIYEDRDILCILDANPASKGHCLVMPKEHFQFIGDIQDSMLNKIFLFVKAMEPAMIEALKAQGMAIHISQGLPDQRVPHFCINMIPRYKDDKLSFEQERQKIDRKEQEKTAELLRKNCQKEVVSKLEHEAKKAQEKKKAEDESEAEKIHRHVKRRMP